MKSTITLFTIFCLFVSCNDSAEKPGKQGSEKSIYIPSKEDEKFISVGYDLSKGHPKGLKVGSEAPDFKLEAPDGSTVHLSKLLEDGPVVVLFYRGQWCPVCIRYFSGFIEDVPKLTEKGVNVIAIGPETGENIEKTVEKSAIDFMVLQDPDLEVMKAYDVLFHVTEAYQEKIRKKFDVDIAENNGKSTAQLPVPATYLIGKDRKIKYTQFDLNYKNRASVDDILKNL